jgi:hypothetical protein
MVDKSENILVEFDYNNISIIDPNKVIDNDGKVQERYVKQENLVMYANLECKVLPRTKLALGVANNDQVQTVSIATINFLKPGDKTFLDNSYTDELTGKDTIKGNGVNQPKLTAVSNPNKSSDFYIRQTINSGGKQASVDNGLLGITSINIRQGLDFLPSITIELEDVKGRAMFEAGDNSPYAAFFNLPYPMFQLTIKGFYGKAVKLKLMLQTFSTRYDTSNGNFKIKLQFFTYKYTLLSEVPMAALIAVPHMYQSRVNIQTVKGGSSNFSNVQDSIVSRGYQKVRELYSEYKSKGMIPDDFPEITVVQMKNRIENFIKNILTSFSQQNLDPLTYVEEYQRLLGNLDKDVYVGAGTSWFSKYMDDKNYLVMKGVNGVNGITEGSKVYTFKSEINTAQKRKNALAELQGIISAAKEKMEANSVCGENGKYTIDGKTKTGSHVPFKIDPSIFPIEPKENDVNVKETYRQRKKLSTEPNADQLKQFKNQLATEGIFNSLEITNKKGSEDKNFQFYIFEGDNRFEDLINQMGKLAKTTKENIQDELTEALTNLLQKKDNGIGFVPNIRNVLAVIFANGEAFLRLMDDVHVQAWNLNDTQIKARRNSILNPETANASVDNLTSGDNKTLPIYPWPQMLTATSGKDGREKFELTYPGDKNVISQTKAYLTDLWPEVEFVEEFIRATTQTVKPPADPTETSNPVTDIQRVSLDAIEFPISNAVYDNKEEIKYFYEIFERIFLTSNYSGLLRSNGNTQDADKVTDVIAEAESINIIQSLSNDNPFIIKKLKEFGINAGNFEILMRHISNDGTGESWQNFIRGIFNTSYIKNKVNNSSFEFLSQNLLNDSKSQPLVSLPGEKNIDDFISNSTSSNIFNLTDTYPFTNFAWVKSELANGNSISDVKSSYNTTKVLTYNSNKKIISNFLDITNDDNRRPFTNFLFNNIKSPIYYFDLKLFYENRSFDSQLPTEGNLRYLNYSGLVSSNQTVSMLNTPYFTNSIQEGVKNFRNGSEYPFVASAYLFLNSLPLSTLREKYKTYETNSVTDLDYIFATLKKFGAVHKLPYAWILKIGSVWNRYKNFVETGVDIIDTSWSGFSYVHNYDPVTNSASRNYGLTINGAQMDIVLEKNTTLGLETSSLMNTGFYPLLINDFNVFYQGFQIYSGYTDTDIQNGFSSGVTLNYVPEAIINMPEGFDPNNPKRDLRVIPWSVYITTLDKTSSYIVPSQGALINQTSNECITEETNQLKYEITGNTAMYNGSVRLFWSAPNYGYFDITKVVKPTPLKYLKQVFNLTGNTKQENFSINGKQDDYTEISEMFSVFEKEILDSFESEFLNFSKSIYDFDSEFISNSDTESTKSFKNFQMLMRNLMKIPKITGTTINTELVSAVQESQLTVLSNLLQSFLNYDVVFKYGNPASFDKRLFYTFSNGLIADPYTWSKYSFQIPTPLPTSGGTVTLSQSITNYPNEWKALQLYVGFSEIPQLRYSNNGSYITDFFVDCNIDFSVDNIKTFAPIIKIYATQKLNDNTLTYNKFVKLMNEYIASTDKFQSIIINKLMPKLQKQLPDVGSTPDAVLATALEGPQTKLEYWESFKALNDKWIAGNDFKTKTLFEDILLMDRANRNIGDKVLVDIHKLKKTLTNINPKTSMLIFVQDILVTNNFVVMNIPSYVNFYNVQDAVKNPVPKPEGTIDFANTMFGTFLNVDYRNSSAKMVCFYAGKPSEQPDFKNNANVRFKGDSFDLRRASDNPLIEDQIGKQDWDKSNKVVGFNVDVGPQNQSIFHGFQIDQSAGQATAESLQQTDELVKQSSGKAAGTQNVSLYNLYKNRSYACTVSMMGNAMIQPTMYFNLRHVPMFSGAYMIQEVNHSIGPGTFETVFKGIRQSISNLPEIDSYIQTLKTNLLTSIIEKNKQDKQAAIKESGSKQQNVISQSNNTVTDATKKPANSSSNYPSCTPLKNYEKYQNITPSTNKAKYKDAISTIISQTADQKLRYLIFTAIYLGSSNGTILETNQHNYSGIDLLQNWGQSGVSYFENLYYCNSNNIPYASFSDLPKHIEFLISRWKDRVGQLPAITAKDIAKFYTLYFSANAKNIDVYNKLSQNPSQLSEIEVSVQQSIDLFKTGSGNVSGTPPPNTPPQGQTNQVIFENSFAFSTYYLQNLKINSGGALTGDFLVLNNGALLTQDYNAKIYLASQMSDILIANFTIKEKTNRGSFVSSPDFIEALELARNRQTYEVGFRVRVDAFPNIIFGNKDFVKVVMPLDCPEEGLNYREIIGTYDWKAIKDNICCKCYGKPYTGMEIVWDGKPCSRNGTTC